MASRAPWGVVLTNKRSRNRLPSFVEALGGKRVIDTSLQWFQGPQKPFKTSLKHIATEMAQTLAAPPPSLSSASSADSISLPTQSRPLSIPTASQPRRIHHFDEIIEEIETSSGSSGHSRSGIVTQPLNVADYPTMEPIIIRGNGNMTLFGLSNTFNNDFPSMLIGRVSREEFEATLSRINNMLRQHHSTNAKLLLLGCLCCCCSFGCSVLWPTLALSKRTRMALEKLLASENSKLYQKLGLNWKLSKERCHSNHAFMEYVLVIDFLPKLQLYQPD